MKISIITVTLNNKAGLIRAIESVRAQTYKNVEHIIVDGGSTDGTVEMLKKEVEKFRRYEDRKISSPSLPTLNDNVQDDKKMTTDNHSITNNQPLSTNYILCAISEKDKGIYDAIDKGIKLATGDVIGLLHSDDFYADEFVLERYAEAFEQSAVSKATRPFGSAQGDFVKAVDSDLVYVKNKAKGNTILSTLYPIPYTTVRYWKAQKKQYTTKTQSHKEILNGWMPPHPTLLVRKEVFERYGLYRTDMKIAADYEMILRLFYKHKITSCYLPITTYCMTIGGASNKSFKNILRKSFEDYQAMKIHRLPFPIKTLLLKNFIKLPQFFRKNL